MTVKSGILAFSLFTTIILSGVFCSTASANGQNLTVEQLASSILYSEQNYNDEDAQPVTSDDRTSIYFGGGVGMGSDKPNPKDNSYCIPPGCETGLALGEGLHLAVGIQQFIGEYKTESLSLALGYWKSGSTYESASAKTLEAIYSRHYGQKRAGVGLVYHIDPEYEVETNSDRTVKTEFDNSLGITFKMHTVIKDPSWRLGVGYTIMRYQADDEDFSANRLEVYVLRFY